MKTNKTQKRLERATNVFNVCNLFVFFSQVVLFIKEIGVAFEGGKGADGGGGVEVLHVCPED